VCSGGQRQSGVGCEQGKNVWQRFTRIVDLWNYLWNYYIYRYVFNREIVFLIVIIKKQKPRKVDFFGFVISRIFISFV